MVPQIDHTSKPLVSVVMPVYNSEKYIATCVNSILLQTYQMFELLIVDDGCTDRTMDIINGIQDQRIRVLKNEVNLGLASSLNRGIANAKGKYIARMDSDDISLPQRLEIQVNYLERHSEIDVLGAAMKYFGTSGFMNRFPQTHELCRARLLFNVCFGHPVLIARANIFQRPENAYNASLLQYSEDYDLYARLVDHYTFGNLNEVLLKYRTYAPQVKSDAISKRRQNSASVRSVMLFRAGIKLTTEQAAIHAKASDISSDLTLEDFNRIHQWLTTIIHHNEKTKYFDDYALRYVIAEQVFEIVYNNPQLNIPLSDALRPYQSTFRVSLEMHAKFYVKRLTLLRKK